MGDEVKEYVRKKAASLEGLSEDQQGQPSTGDKLTAKAVMVFRVLALISAGMNARMKLGILEHGKLLS